MAEIKTWQERVEDLIDESAEWTEDSQNIVDTAKQDEINELRAALAERVPLSTEPSVISGGLLAILFNNSQVPLNEMETDEDADSWWKHYAARVRNEIRALRNNVCNS